MNEEERKAVEILNTFKLRRKTKNYKEISLEDSQSVEIVLNLIERLQKENEKLNEKILSNVGIYQLAFKDGEESYRRKVKDKIEKYKKLSDKFYVKFLESNRYNTDIREKGIKCDAIILALEELIGEREEK